MRYIPDWHEAIYALLERYILPSTRILEVGAGGSHTLCALAKRLGCQGYGIEPDMAGIIATERFASQLGVRVLLTQGDGFLLPFPDDAFDVVYSLGLIEHFTPVRSMRLLTEHIRTCRPGGRVIVSVPNYLNLPHTIRKWVDGTRYPFFPERSYTPRQLRRAMHAAGLRTVIVDGILPLWGMLMIPSGWRLVALLNRLGISTRLNQLQSSCGRALLGYMTYYIGQKPSSML